METFTHEGLTITVQPAAADLPVLNAHWTGKSTSRDPATLLLPWFHRLLDHAKDIHAHVEMHFEALEHFNSSTIAALIQVINDARTHGVSLVLLYDGSLRWQAASFQGLQRAMQLFEGKGLAKVEFVPIGSR
jgi:hypothetical protein